jgi:hypothetical protein
VDGGSAGLLVGRCIGSSLGLALTVDNINGIAQTVVRARIAGNSRAFRRFEVMGSLHQFDHLNASGAITATSGQHVGVSGRLIFLT